MAYPTNPIYKLVKDPLTEEVTTVKKQIGDSEPYRTIYIPFNEDNTDYQEYLKWVAEGNTAEESEENTAEEAE